jgi:EAL domain-containing protein (putative c-di-GMP-specific phosphodiesterase class I)/GAF domain-containing protein
MPRQPRLLPDVSHGHAGERYAQALVALTRRVWHPDCQLDDAFAVICETAAETLHVARTNIWRYDPSHELLVCLHAFTRESGHALPTALETLPVDGEYVAEMGEVRAIDAHDVTSAPATTASGHALQDYLERHRIRSLLDAPVRVEGELVGIICHEQVDWPRRWTRDEVAFAGSMGDFVAMAIEIARRRETEQALQHLRLHDAATGLPNADYLAELLRDQIQHADATHRLAVLHLRVDTVQAGALLPEASTVDALLHAIGLQLRSLAPTNALARVRSDALALATRFDADDEDFAVRLAERVLALVGSVLGTAVLAAPAAVGIAFHEPGEDDPYVLLQHAEQAADQARERGAAWDVFDLERHRALLARLQQERELHDAFAQGRFEVHFQPERDLVAARWRGAEALLRLRDGDRLVPAQEFIEVAEQAGLIVALGRWVLEQACAAAAGWPDSPEHPTQVRVNVSARQFESGDLVGDVAGALERAGLAPARLCLEITETTLMHDVPRAIELLHALKALGVQVAIDDFGTGYSSLVYLKRFPADTLKIDRSFVPDQPRDPPDTALVAAVVQLAQALGLDVVAEGVERRDQCDALRAFGVEHMQGWLFSAEVPATDVARLLQ